MFLTWQTLPSQDNWGISFSYTSRVTLDTVNYFETIK